MADADKHRCVCGNDYDTKASLRAHQRRYCRVWAEQNAEQPVDDGHVCPECQRAFTTASGLSQHRRKAHSVAYNREAEERDQLTRKKNTFSELEILHIVEEELRDPSRLHMNLHLAAHFDREQRHIINLRKSHRYKALKAQIAADREEADLAPLPFPLRRLNLVPLPRP